MSTLSISFAPDMPAAAVEILSVDQRPIGQLWLEPGKTQSLEVPSLDAVVQVFMPSGEAVTLSEPGRARRKISRRALIAASSERSLGLTRAPTPLSRRTPLSSSQESSLEPTVSEEQRTSGGFELDHFQSEGPVPPRLLEPYHATLNGEAAIVREGVGAGGERGLLLEPAAGREKPFDIVINSNDWEDGPRLTIRLPGSLASAFIALAESENDRALQVSVRTRNESADALGAYLARGNLRAASGMTTWAERAHHMLQDKVRDPNAAVVGAYLLLRLRRFALLHDWARNLANRFPDLADGCVIWAWQMIHQDGDSQEAERYLRMAAERPLPVYTTGLRLLLDGLQLMGEAGEGSLQAVRRRTGFVMWDSPFTATLSGRSSRLSSGLRLDIRYATDRIAVASDALAWVSFQAGTLTVEFGDGTSYTYDSVPKEVYQELLHADSKGVFYNERIRNAYPSRRIG